MSVGIGFGYIPEFSAISRKHDCNRNFSTYDIGRGVFHCPNIPMNGRPAMAKHKPNVIRIPATRFRQHEGTFYLIALSRNLVNFLDSGDGGLTIQRYSVGKKGHVIDVESEEVL